MPKTLIVPVDGSAAGERALQSAQRLAAHLAPCDLVVMTASTADDDERREYLHALVGQATETRRRAEFVEGEPADAIAEMAGSLPDAVVCMATHGRGRVTAPLLGSVATEVLQRVTTPVLLVGPHCQADWWHFPAKLVVCWGGEGSNAILPWAREWAHDLHLELWLESVFHPLDTRVAAEPRGEFQPALAVLQMPPDDVHLLVLRDDLPSGAIVRSAQELPATLLAMTTHARSGFGRAVLGSVAMEVVHHSPCPVLVVHHGKADA